MDTAAEIISGKSIGGIYLGEDGTVELIKIYEEGRKVSVIENESMLFYEIDDGVVTISVDKRLDKIRQICCKKPYSGKYKEIFAPGMRVGEILAHSKKQRIVCGFLIINNDLNAGFNIPDKFDEFDSIKGLPVDLILDEFHVMESGWCGPGRE